MEILERKRLTGYFEKAQLLLNKTENIEFLHPTPLPRQYPASLHPEPRLLIPLSGKMRLEAAFSTTIDCRDLAPGEAVYAPPFGWSIHHWNCPGEFISLAIRRDYLRFLYLNCNGNEMPGSASSERLYIHSSDAGPRIIRLLSGVLNSCVNRSCLNETSSGIYKLLLNEAVQVLKSDTVNSSNKAQRTWYKLYSYLQENYSSHKISRENTASHFGLHPTHVSRLFRAHGENFNALLLRLRLEQAQAALAYSDFPIKEIADSCGFISTGYFIRKFKTAYGCTPGVYRDNSNIIMSPPV